MLPPVRSATLTMSGAAMRPGRFAIRRASAEVDRIRAQIVEIANSGLTVSKLTVAASLLGDLVRS